jgi:hypothetical protein
MHILSPTPLQKKKLEEMIVKLFPEWKYVRFKRHGLISLSKSFWYSLFKRNIVHITELCTVYIPERLEKLESRTIEELDGRVHYQRVYNIRSHTVLDLLHHRANGIIDYLYNEYTYVKYGIHKAYYTQTNLLPEKSYKLSEILFGRKEGSVVLFHFSNAYIQQALKHWKNVVSALNHPVLLSKTLDMWFRPEIKEELRRINIRIAYA